MSNEREAFEKDAIQAYPHWKPEEITRRRCDGAYFYLEDRWQGWQARGQQEPEPCNVCNALIVSRNPTHYDADDLAAAAVRANILSERIKVE